MRLAIFGKHVFEEKKAYIPFLFSCITKEDIEYAVYEKYAKNLHSFFPDIPIEKTFSNYKDLTDYQPDILISIGGDGSFLDTVNLIKNSGIPVLFPEQEKIKNATNRMIKSFFIIK
jgi:NAD+ kinase